MFSKIAIIRNIKPVYVLYGGILIALLLLGAYLQLEPQKQRLDVASIVAEMGEGQQVFETIRDTLPDIINKWGVQGAIDINEYAFVNNKYGIYNCHVLSHMTGHEAVVYYGEDYEKVIAHDTHFCELGYRHGAEAQVALSGGDYKNNLYRMCDVIKAKNPDAECYHGAGHAFMNESLDVDASLAMCDDLINETHTIEDVTPCYNAVFAELTNLVGGTDGGTGIVYTGGPPLTMDEKTPLEYCSKFDDRYRIQCVFEFSGLGVSESSTPADIERKLIACSNEEYDAELEEACIRSVSAVGTQHELAANHAIVVPKHILGLSDEMRRAYILGAGTEMKQYLISGTVRDWESFCGAFTEPEDTQLCEGIFKDI